MIKLIISYWLSQLISFHLSYHICYQISIGLYMIKISSENIHGLPFKVLKCWVKIPYLLDFYAHFKQFITFITQYHLMTLIIIDIIITSVFIGYQYHIIIETWPFISYQYHLEVGRIYHIEFFIEKLCEKLSYRFCYQI